MNIRDNLKRLFLLLSMFIASGRKNRPFWALIFITRRCNQNCKICYVYDNRDGFMDLEDFREIVDHLKKLGVKVISLFGGNITLHLNLCEMVDYIHERGLFSYLSIDLTSCSLAKIEEIFRRHPHVISFSCDHVNSTYGDKKGLNLLEDKISFIRKKSPCTLLQCNIALLKGNIGNVPLIISQLHKLCDGKIGFTVFPTSFPFETGRDLSLAKQLQICQNDKGQILELIGWLRQRRKDGWIIMNPDSYLNHLPEHLCGEGSWNCAANKSILTVDTTGEIIQCSYQPSEIFRKQIIRPEVESGWLGGYSRATCKSFEKMWARKPEKSYQLYEFSFFHITDLTPHFYKQLRRPTRENQKDSNCLKNCFSQAYACTSGYESSFRERLRLLKHILSIYFTRE